MRKSFDLSACARVIADSLRSADPNREAAFYIADGLRAVGDPRLLNLLLTNLLENSWKYCSLETRTEIRFEQRPGRSGTCYAVSDNGTGFDDSQAERIFQPFVRAHSQDEFTGEGIGLATVKKVLEMHGGEIRAESAPGKGATFLFTLGGNSRL